MPLNKKPTKLPEFGNSLSTELTTVELWVVWGVIVVCCLALLSAWAN